MKALLGLIAALTFLSHAAAPRTSSERTTLLIAGGTEGYLSPCGCTSPMSGGIKRRITLLKRLSANRKVTVLENGPLIEGHTRQDQIKAETLAEAMALVGVDVTHLGHEESLLGGGIAESIAQLSRGEIVSSSHANAADAATVTKDGFLFSAIDARPYSAETDQTVRAFLSEAREKRVTLILMLRGDADAARSVARNNQGIGLVIYTRQGSPAQDLEHVGETVIVSPGEHGKYVVEIEFDGKRFTSYQSYDLGPEYPDDPGATEVYNNYLARVGRERLIEMLPRSAKSDFAGSRACAPCHEDAVEAWKKSAHSRALATLEREGHDRDPDCVACHVVGLDSVTGFRDRPTTPDLTDVGCESCHGPARAHAMAPAENRIETTAQESCGTCHDTSHSPNFRFEDYWPRIAH